MCPYREKQADTYQEPIVNLEQVTPLSDEGR